MPEFLVELVYCITDCILATLCPLCQCAMNNNASMVAVLLYQLVSIYDEDPLYCSLFYHLGNFTRVVVFIKTLAIDQSSNTE